MSNITIHYKKHILLLPTELMGPTETTDIFCPRYCHLLQDESFPIFSSESLTSDLKTWTSTADWQKRGHISAFELLGNTTAGRQVFGICSFWLEDNYSTLEERSDPGEKIKM